MRANGKYSQHMRYDNQESEGLSKASCELSYISVLRLASKMKRSAP